jgi:acyl dehydratase
MPAITFEDFTTGSVTEIGPRLVTADEIVAFAAAFDPQPMHLGDEGGRAAGLGGLIASGWHTCAILMRMIVDGFVRDAASMGSPGVEEVRWLKPVRPGDHLTARRTVLETRVSRSRPEMGLVTFLFEVRNQSGDVVMELTSPLMIGRRTPLEISD